MTPITTTTERPDHRFRTLESADTALLLIDHQVGTMLFGIQDVDPVNLRNNTLELAEAAVAFDVPVILTTSNPTAVNGPLFAELTDLLPDAPIIDRTAINAWDDPAFVDAVRATGRHQLVMAGVTVDVCLALPAITAAGEGWDVYGVIDASGSTNEHGLLAAIARMGQAGVKVSSTNMVIAEMLRDWSRAEAPQAGAVFGRHQPNAAYLGQFMQGLLDRETAAA
jgi:nicotinamidase-related amidase